MKLILTILIGVIQVIISIIPISGRKLADKRRVGFRRLTTNGWIVCFLCLLSCVITIWLFRISEIESQKAEKIAEQLRIRNENNDSIIKELALANLDSIKKVLNNEVTVLKSANHIINFQAHSLEQITGGNNKPAIIWSIGGKSGKKFDRQKMEYIGEIEEIYSLNLQAANLGKTNIKSLIVTVEDKYSYAKKFIQKDSSMTFIPKDEYYNFGYDPIDVNASLFKEYTFEVNNLPEGKQKKVYNIPIPVGGKSYNYRIDIEWSNGSYSEILKLEEGKSGLHVNKLTILEKDHEVIDQYKFFGKKRPLEFTTEFIEGKPIIFKGELYHVFWHKKTQLVCVSQVPLSILTYQTYGNTTVNNQKDLEKSALKMLETEFGM